MLYALINRDVWFVESGGKLIISKSNERKKKIMKFIIVCGT